MKQQMFTALAELAAAPKPEAPDALNTAAIWGVVVFVAGLLAAWLGLSLMGQSKKGNLSGAAKSSGVAGIGLLWVILGVGGLATGIVLSFVTFFFND